jgi:Domain of unknown function (DUF1707)
MPGDPRIRASDADRDRAAALLREHHDRLDKAMEAKTLGELDALMADLPSIDLYRLPDAALRRVPPGAMAPRPGGEVTSPNSTGWAIWAAMSSVLIAIWLVTALVTGGGAWFPWPIFFVIFFGRYLARRYPHRGM